jgi:hypothetical protein
MAEITITGYGGLAVIVVLKHSGSAVRSSIWDLWSDE